ncbi:unnamed protein product [Arabis nemorensis]|uniref:Uncharacterized protein n=1 Tax=Arabis nemorensis TaxID=586526 RepID=A0A565BKH8_9BRAS|nr:unnamed protein product [Arabis nemorensis]
MFLGSIEEENPCKVRLRLKRQWKRRINESTNRPINQNVVHVKTLTQERILGPPQASINH